MPEIPLHDEIRQLAEQVAAIENEDVIDSAASIAAQYHNERFVALGLLAVDSMTEPGATAQAEVVIDEADPRLETVRVRLRDRLSGLLKWAGETGRA